MAVAEGRVLSHADAKQRMARWLKWFGPSRCSRLDDLSSEIRADRSIGLFAIAYALTYDVRQPSEHIVTTLTASEARANLYRLMDQTAESHRPIVISGKRSNAVLVSEEDWTAIQETLFLLSVPGMRESIKASMAEPVDACVKELDW